MKKYTVKELTSMVWKSICLIICLAIICGLAMGLVAKHRQKTTYLSTRNVLISHNLTKYSSTITKDGQNISIVTEDQNMMDTYKGIVNDNQILRATRKRLPKKLQKKYSVKDLSKVVNAKSKPQSLILSIKAETKSAKNSALIVNATADALKQQLPNIQPGVGRVVPLSRARKADAISITRPHTKKYVAVGVALGGLIGIIVSFCAVTFKNMVKD